MIPATNNTPKKEFSSILFNLINSQTNNKKEGDPIVNWLSATRLIMYGVITLGLLAPQIIGLLLYPPLAPLITLVHHKLTTRIIGLRVTSLGKPSSKTGTLFVSNHLSYFDIIVLGSLVSGKFVAKSEVGDWPIFGFLAKITQTIFIDRNRRSSHKHKKLIEAKLKNLENLILFPEGTSTDGRRVLPFKSTLFAAAKELNATIQPITIKYTRVNGIPITYSTRPFFSWYGDMELAPHLCTALSLGALDVEVEFHELVQADQFSNRKRLATYCQEIVSKGISGNFEK